MKGHRLIIIFVFVILIVIFSLQVRTLIQDTWWQCDVTVQAPVLNHTKDSKHHVFISIEMRTSLQHSCWYVEQLDKSSATKAQVSVETPISACLTKEIYGRLRSGYQIDEAKSVFSKTRTLIIVALVFVCLALAFQLANTCVCNGCLVVTNIVLLFVAAMCTMAAVIIFSKNVNFEATFNKYDIGLIPVLLVKDVSLSPESASLLEFMLNKLTKSNALAEKYSTGSSFVFLWVTLILLVLSILMSIFGHIYALRSGDSDYKKAPSGGGGFSMPRLGSFDFGDDDD